MAKASGRFKMKDLNTSPEFLTEEQVGEMLGGVSTSFIRKERSNGRLKFYKFGRTVRIKREDAESYAEQRLVSQVG